MTDTSFSVGSLVKARGREWVVLPDSTHDLLVLRPLGFLGKCTTDCISTTTTPLFHSPSCTPHLHPNARYSLSVIKVHIVPLW